MFGVKKRKIQDLEQRLDAGEQQYRAAMATIEELRTLLARAGGGELVEIQAAVAQMRDDKAQLQASMEQQQAESARQIAAEADFVDVEHTLELMGTCSTCAGGEKRR